MASVNSTKTARSSSPVVIRPAVGNTSERPVNLIRLLPAVVASAVLNLSLIGLFALLPATNTLSAQEAVDDENTVKSDEDKNDPPPPPLTVTDEDDEGKDVDTDIKYNVPRLDDKSVPGEVNPNETVGIEGAKDDANTSVAAPSGLGRGSGKAPDGPGDGTGQNFGSVGGYGGGSSRELAGSFYGRSGATKEKALREGGGTKKSERAVALGLEWIVRHQSPNGSWSLDGFHRAKRCSCQNRSNHNNDTAGTAFGLLPLLGAGMTHKAAKGNKYHRTVLAGLNFLMRKQNKGTGDFGGGMYAHGLASIAICEAYGLTQDPYLKRSAQFAIKFIERAQHEEGGWRYSPRQAGDTSVVGWQVMALKSAQMAGLVVDPRVMKRATRFLDLVMNETNYGYGYMGNTDASETRTAVGLLCRQYLQNWGPASPNMVKGINNFLNKNLPVDGKNMYYYYYATQVLHHFGGESWKNWNEKMREILVKEQDQGLTPRYLHQKGSWAPGGDFHASAGGRLMCTSLSLLTLEVYYRHLPLYRRDVVDKQADMKK